MDRLISEKSLLDKIDEWKGFDTVTIRLSTLRDIVKAIPSAKPNTGHWIYDRTRDWDGECKYECSECGMGSDVDYDYCMRCGTKMVEQQEGAIRND